MMACQTHWLVPVICQAERATELPYLRIMIVTSFLDLELFTFQPWSSIVSTINDIRKKTIQMH